MVTREMVRAEIDEVQDKDLETLYRIIKALSEPSELGTYSPTREIEALEQSSDFFEKTAGTRQNEPLTGEDQNNYEVRDELRFITAFRQVEQDLRNSNEALKLLVETRTAELKQANEQLQQEVEAHKQADLALQESKNRIRIFSEATPLPILISRVSDGVILYANAQLSLTFGLPPDEMAGRKTPDFYYNPDERRQLLETFEKDGRVHNYEIRVKRADGTPFWIAAFVQPLVYEGEQAFFSVLQDITERKQRETERGSLLAAEREQRLLAETLGEVFLTLTSQTNRDAVLDEILREVQRLVSHSATNITLLEDNTLRVVRWQGYDAFGEKEMVANLVQSRTDFPLDAKIVQSGQPMVISDTHKNPDWVDKLSWIRSSISVPICLQDRVLGLLRLDSNLPDEFSAKHLERLLPLANAAAIAMENARLYEQVQLELVERKQAEEETLKTNQMLLSLQVAGATIASSLDLRYILNIVTQEMVNLIEAHGCVVYRWNQPADTISVITRFGVTVQPPVLNQLLSTSSSNDTQPELVEGVGGVNDYIETQSEVYNLVNFPLTKQVLMTHRIQHMTINQTDIDPSELAYMQTIEVKTLLMLPMEFQDRVVGLVEVMDKQIERTFTPDEIALAQQLANQAASAIENARLYDQVQQELAERVRTEKALRESEARLDGIITTATDAIITIDARQRLLLFNAAAEQMFRYKTGDVIGQSLDLILPKQFRDQNGIKTHATEIQGHIMGQRAGGERFPIEARTSQVEVSGQQLYTIILRDITQQKTREAIVEEERARIARDLHDGLAQNLYFLGLKLDYLRKQVAHNPEGVRDELLALKETVQVNINDVRRTIFALRPVNLEELGFLPAIRQYLHEFGEQMDLEITLTVQGNEATLPATLEPVFFRIIQEGLNNIAKHAKGRRVWVELSVDSDQAGRLTVRDDGVGFDAQTLPSVSEGKLGLRQMEERVTALGGRFSIESTPGQGVALQAEIPL